MRQDEAAAGRRANQDNIIMLREERCVSQF
jgi:hypothetical protein